MPYLERISQREIARRLSLNQTTVSRAMSGHPSIPEVTCQRVLEEARRLGYRPDPVLASLNAYRRTKRPISQGQSLAWLGIEPWPASDGGWVYELALFHAAKARAEELGYSLNYFWRDAPDMSLHRLETIFDSRGIAGLIFGPQRKAHARIRMNIGNFAAVSIGRALFAPMVDQVSTDHFQTMEVCYRRLIKLGYKRIGFALTKVFNERIEGIWYGSFHTQQARHPASASIPVYLGRDDDGSSFRSWFAEWKPDALITMPWELGCLPWLAETGVHPPGHIGVALLAVPAAEKRYAHYSGVHEPVADLARFAVDVLVGRIRNNDRGIPSDRRVHLLPGKWQDNATTRMPARKSA